MAKPSEPKKASARKADSKDKGGETPVSSKETPAPRAPKSGNTPETRPVAQAKGKAAPSAKSGAKAGDHTEATGHDHPSQSEHAKALWQKLHGTSDQRAKGGPPGGPPGGRKGFDPNQFKGGGKSFGGGGANQMLRRTQGKGGGGGGGGGGGAGA
jgi:hypothetical protein